eukprot:11168730-Lingulodinium_polyedra.AAC.1
MQASFASNGQVPIAGVAAAPVFMFAPGFCQLPRRSDGKQRAPQLARQTRGWARATAGGGRRLERSAFPR